MAMVILPVIMGMATVRIRTTETAATVLPTTERECIIRSLGMTFFIAGISLVAGVINLSGKANFRDRSSE
ncbi:MAG: hypothetical protein K2O34_11685 [Acetatifactor sp.]|nr:hypothetical protein [Acetatifactor sp.]